MNNKNLLSADINKEKRFKLVFGITVILLLVAFFLSMNLGKVRVNLVDMINILLSKLGITEGFAEDLVLQKETVFFNVRLPRSITAIFVGAGLAATGAVMQGLYRNPLAAPDVLGVSQAANFGVGVAIFFFSAGTLGVQLTSFFFGIFALVFTFLMVSRVQGSNITTLVLIGVIISAIFQAGLTLLLYLSDPYSEMLRINYWLLGAFNTVTWSDVQIVVPVVLIGLLFLSIFSWRLNILAQGDEEAQALGINLKLWRGLYIFFVALVVSVCTASVGNISWVGLIIPHIARYLVGSNQAKVVPYSALLGALFLLLIDTVVRNLPWGEIPISIITSFIAAPFLFALILSKKNRRRFFK